MQATKEGLKLHTAHSSSLCCWYFIGQKQTHCKEKHRSHEYERRSKS